MGSSNDLQLPLAYQVCSEDYSVLDVCEAPSDTCIPQTASLPFSASAITTAVYHDVSALCMALGSIARPPQVFSEVF